MNHRPCRVCEERSLSDRVQEASDDMLEPVVTPSGIVHLVETGSGWTLCGRDGTRWPPAA